MARLIFDNLSRKQAEALAEWFEEQGEQQCDMWLAESDTPSPIVDYTKPMKWVGDDYIVQTETTE